jgi:hypothetical protein
MARQSVPGEKPLYWIFQKKSPRRIETRQSDVTLVRERLKAAQRDYEDRYG